MEHSSKSSEQSEPVKPSAHAQWPGEEHRPPLRQPPGHNAKKEFTFCQKIVSKLFLYKKTLTPAVHPVRLRLEPGSALASVRPGPVRDAGGVPAGAEALPAGRVARVHRAAVRDTAPGATVLVPWCALAPDQKLKYFNFGFYISPSLLWQWQCRFFFFKKSIIFRTCTTRLC